MKKTILLYISMILSIIFFAIFINIIFEPFSFIEFSHKSHVLVSTIISVLLLLIAVRSEILYSSTQDQRFLILGYGFLVGMIFKTIHIFTIPYFPYGNLSLVNIEKNPTAVYLFIANIILPLAIYYSLIVKTSFVSDKNFFRLKVLNVYFYTFLTFALFPLIIYYLLPNLLHYFYIVTHTLEYINTALYFMLASILISARFGAKEHPINKLIVGLLILGITGLFYINPMLLPIKEIFAHVFNSLGLLFILLGLSELPDLESSLRVKDKLAANLSLLLILFYVVFISLISASLKIIFPQYSGYIFITALLFFQFIIYIFSTISWSKVVKVYVSAEHDQALLRVYDSMRRISNSHIIKNTIINEINKEYKPDKCFLVIYNPENNSFEYDNYYEYLPSKTLSKIDSLDAEKLEFEDLKKVFNNLEINFSNVERYIKNYSLEGTPIEKLFNDLNIKSMYSFPINYEGKLLGYLILQYKKDYKKMSTDDLSFLEKMAKQIGIAMKDKK